MNLESAKGLQSCSQYDSLYFLQGKVVETEALITEDKKDETSLWHSRLGHMSQKG